MSEGINVQRLKTVFTNLSDHDLRGVLAAAPSLAQIAARAAKVSATDLGAGRTRALRSIRAAATSATAKSLEAWFLPMLSDVVARYADHIGSRPPGTEDELTALISHLGSNEPRPVALLFLAAAADGAIPGFDLLDERWDNITTQLSAGSITRKDDELRCLDLSGQTDEIEHLHAELADLQSQAAEVAQTLHSAADAVGSGQLSTHWIAGVEDWFRRAEHLIGSVTISSGTSVASLPDAAAALALRKEELRQIEDLARHAEDESKREEGRQVVLAAVEQLRELGLHETAEELFATLNSDGTPEQTAVTEPDASDEPEGIVAGPAQPEFVAYIERLSTVEGDAEQDREDADIDAGITAEAEHRDEDPIAASEPLEYLDGGSGPFDVVDDEVAAVVTWEPEAGAPEPMVTAAAADVPASPWEDGTPPRIVSLLLEEKYGLAWLLAEAAGESQTRRQALRLFAAAMSCDPADLAAKQAALAPDEDDVGTAGADEARVLLAACLRFGLTFGYSPVGLHQLVDRANLEPAASYELISIAVDAVRRGRVRLTGEDASLPQMLEQWSDLAAEGRQLRQNLQQRNIKFTRASRILHDLVKDGKELGIALADIVELANAGPPPDGRPDERIEELQRLAGQLRDRAKLRNLIDKADARVSTKGQQRNTIVASARTRLEESIDKVREFVDRALRLYAAIQQIDRSTDLHQIVALRRAARQHDLSAEIRTVGAAALQQVAQWIAQEPAAAGVESVDDLEQHAARLVFEVGRDEYGRPDESVTLGQLKGVLSGRTVPEAIRGHLRRGNVAIALRLLEDVPEPDQPDLLREECQQGRRDLKQKHGQIVAAIESATAKLRSVGLDDTAHRVEGHLERLRAAPPDRFDLIIEPLEQVFKEADSKLRDHRDGLRDRVKGLSLSFSEEARITDLLDSGDEVTAEEFLTLLDSGQRLPDEDVEHSHDDFTAFFPQVVEMAVEAANRSGDSKSDVIAQLGRKLGARDSTSEIIRDGIASWQTLRQHKIANTQTPQLRRVLGDVLRMLGLLPAEGNYLNTLSDAPRTRSALFQVRAKLAGRSYVPQFGTQANGRYNVAIMWERATPGRLLGLLPDRLRTGPNIILYFGTLPAAQRLELRNLSRPGRDTSGTVLLVDDAVIGWLASREEPDFRLTQRITLPFSSINPYTPFAGGDVPDEVFVGRDRERAELESPTGSMFVYGGRQLGKSALLRRVEKLFTENTTRSSTGRRVALYLDLKSEGIGESREPKELWALLNRHLRALDVLPSGMAANAGPQVVAEGIKRWLDKDDANRLLLLLDESDLFLTADFAPKDSDSGARFQTLQRLKNLMESSGRRFKPVFAGLHQVQRFHDSANTPVAHGGTDILIGPLRAAEVRKLIAEPLRAIGYEFERSDLVWRIAAFTNYQASLVQIFCEALVNHLRERRLPSVGGRVMITSQDIDAVYANRDVRNLIGQRFRWTINLDNRYRVIAIVVALLSNESPAGARFNPEDLREHCETYWPEAFSSDVLTRKEFIRYLDEMVGLGVLRRIGESYGMRSPNVVAMLGTPGALEHELNEASVHFELPYEYNPTMSRAVMSSGSRRAAPRRSPLTDADVAALIGESNHDASNTSRVLRAGARYSTALVTGSPALGVDRVIEALTVGAAERDRIHFETVTLAEVPRILAGAGQGRHRFMLVNTPPGRGQQQFETEYARALRAVAALRTVRAIMVVDTAEYVLPDEQPAASEALLPLNLRRWSAEGLRAWHDFPFDNPQERARLHELTSGWPTLVENAVLLVSSGRSTGDVLDTLATPFTDAEDATRFLADVGVSRNRDDLTVWAQYCANIDPLTRRIAIEAMSREDLEAIGVDDVVRLVARLADLDIIEEDLRDEGWVLDRIVAAALIHDAP